MAATPRKALVFTNKDWEHVYDSAAGIVNSYSTYDGGNPYSPDESEYKLLEHAKVLVKKIGKNGKIAAQCGVLPVKGRRK